MVTLPLHSLTSSVSCMAQVVSEEWSLSPYEVVSFPVGPLYDHNHHMMKFPVGPLYDSLISLEKKMGPLLSSDQSLSA
jgi:hypothetical protein